MPAWLTLRIALYIAGALAGLGALWWLYAALTASPKAEARLGRNTTEAAQESGRDAVDTVAAASEREANSEVLSRTSSEKIRNAEGARDPVAAPVRDAGLTALCARKAYANNPRCASSNGPE